MADGEITMLASELLPKGLLDAVSDCVPIDGGTICQVFERIVKPVVMTIQREEYKVLYVPDGELTLPDDEELELHAMVGELDLIRLFNFAYSTRLNILYIVNPNRDVLPGYGVMLDG